MPAKVEEAFERATRALFPDRGTVFPGAPKTCAEVWNRLALRFPQVYRAATPSRSASKCEERLRLLLGKDAAGLANMFSRRLEGSSSAPSFKEEMENWWREAST